MYVGVAILAENALQNYLVIRVSSLSRHLAKRCSLNHLKIVALKYVSHRKLVVSALNNLTIILEYRNDKLSILYFNNISAKLTRALYYVILSVIEILYC